MKCLSFVCTWHLFVMHFNFGLHGRNVMPTLSHKLGKVTAESEFYDRK